MLRYGRSRVLVDAIWPRAQTETTLVRELVLVLGLTAFVALSARISFFLPFTPVPITLQPLAVLLTGALLGRWRGAFVLLAYLGEGLAGLPVFSAGRSAWSPASAALPAVPLILGPTAGYLFSYPFVAFLVGWLAERGWDRRYWTAVVALTLGTAVIYLFGTLWLAQFSGSVQLAVAQGILPFLPGDAAKILVGAAVLPSGWALLRGRGAT